MSKKFEEPHTRKTFLLPDTVIAALEAIARERDIKLADLVREALAEYAKAAATTVVVLVLAATLAGCTGNGCNYRVIPASNQIVCVPPVGAK